MEGYTPPKQSQRLPGEELMYKYNVVVGDREFTIEIEYRSEQYSVIVNGEEQQVAVNRLGKNRMLLLLDQQALEIDVDSNGIDGERTVFLRGVEIPVHVEQYNLAQLRKTAGMSSSAGKETSLRAPMPGLIVEMKAEAGQTVKQGEPLVVVEAMKMENVVKAKADMIVKRVCVSQGDSVEKDAILLEFE